MHHWASPSCEGLTSWIKFGISVSNLGERFSRSANLRVLEGSNTPGYIYEHNSLESPSKNLSGQQLLVIPLVVCPFITQLAVKDRKSYTKWKSYTQISSYSNQEFRRLGCVSKLYGRHSPILLPVSTWILFVVFLLKVYTFLPLTCYSKSHKIFGRASYICKIYFCLL